MTSKGTLYLIPTMLGESPFSDVLPQKVVGTITSIRYFIVENIRTTRRFFSALQAGINIDELTFFELNKHTPSEQIPNYLGPARQGENIGLLSEVGLPGIADPGSNIVMLAHVQDVPVKPLTGPSSIFLALMASGLNGQNFAFNGYLPIPKQERQKTIRKLEKRSLNENQAQIFMEAPYRNVSLLKDILQTCKPETQLCIAVDITSAPELIKTKPVSEWKKRAPELHKRPAIFILMA